MKNYIQAGANISVTATAAIASGEPALVGALFGVAQGAAAIGGTVTLLRTGVFELPKTSAQAWAVGAKIYFNSGTGECTTVSSGNKLVGCAVQDAADPSATGIVLLDGVFR
jgi:predicted RecA/RadA family phage recombinase